MNYIGRRIFFDKKTGNVIAEVAERAGLVYPTTVEQDIKAYKALSELNRDSFDYIDVPYGKHSADFQVATGYRVNTLTKTLEFSYPDKTAQEPEYRKPLVEELRGIVSASKTADDRWKELDKSTADVEALRKAKIAQLKEACDNAIATGFKSDSTGYTFGFTIPDQSNFQQQTLVFLADPSEVECEWKTEDAGVVMLTREQFMGLLTEGKAHVRAITGKYWQKKAQVEVMGREDILKTEW